MRRRAFLSSSVAAAVTAASLSKAAEAQASDGTGLKVGAGRAAIGIPSSLLPLDNFTTVHDDLYVRILLLEDGSRRVALTVLDLTSISAEAISAIRAVITKAAGVATADIVVTVTHTFSAPHVQSTSTSMGTAQYVEQIKQATSTAIAAAVKGLKAARVGYGTGECDVQAGHIRSATAITKVFGDGQKLIVVAVEYDQDVDTSTLSTSTFAVTDRTITKVYANRTTALAERGRDGHYVIVELSPDDTAAALWETGQGSGTPTGTPNTPAATASPSPSGSSGSGAPGGGGPEVGDSTPGGTIVAAKATLTQKGTVTTTRGARYPAIDNTLTTSSVMNPIVDDFQQFTFDDPATGQTLKYNLRARWCRGSVPCAGRARRTRPGTSPSSWHRNTAP